MIKQEILDYFKDINYAYNDCGRLESLSYMLDKLIEDYEKQLELQHDALRVSSDMISYLFHKLNEIVCCKDCKHWGEYACHITSLTGQKSQSDWFCADGERREK